VTNVPQVPPVVQEHYCGQCCKRQAVHQDGKRYICSLCGSALEPPADPQACPRGKGGLHNPYRWPEGWRCSQCGVAVPEPPDADIITL